MGTRFCCQARYMWCLAAVLAASRVTSQFLTYKYSCAGVTGDQVTLVHVISNPRASSTDGEQAIWTPAAAHWLSCLITPLP